ncbi:MAG: hypothetical protein ACRD8Z_12995 [Nitrososphaeraceae archaeon]
MKRNDIITTTHIFLVVLGTWLMIMMTPTGFGTDRNILSPVFANMNRSILLLTDLHLEECIKQLQLDNAEDALDHCQLADHELGVLLNDTADE